MKRETIKKHIKQLEAIRREIRPVGRQTETRETKLIDEKIAEFKKLLNK